MASASAAGALHPDDEAKAGAMARERAGESAPDRARLGTRNECLSCPIPIRDRPRPCRHAVTICRTARTVRLNGSKSLGSLIAGGARRAAVGRSNQAAARARRPNVRYDTRAARVRRHPAMSHAPQILHVSRRVRDGLSAASLRAGMTHWLDV